MKLFLLFVLLVTVHFAEAQNVDSVSKIIIKYSSGNSRTDTLMRGRGEVIEICPVGKKNFKISKQLSITYYGKPNSRNDTIRLVTDRYSLIPKQIIKYLIGQLNTTKDNFTISFIKPRLKSPSEKLIMNVASVDSASKWRLLDNDVTEKERRDLIKQIQKFNKLDAFIALHKPNPEYSTVVTDYWNSYRVYFINGKDTTAFGCQLINLLGQSFSKFRNHSEVGTFVNLEMNTILEAMLPKSSFFKKNIGINSLTEEYIKWYLGNCFD